MNHLANKSKINVTYRKSCQKNANQYLGVARIFDWGGPNHKSHAMTSSETSKEKSFVAADIVEWKIRSRGLVLARN